MDLVEAHAGGFAQTSRHPWERARLALAKQLIRTHVPLAPDSVVLDVGCGDTFVAESIARDNPTSQVHAVDSAFTPELIGDIRRRLSTPNVGLFTTLVDVPRTRAAALVLLMDVLEHVSDDVGLLRSIVASDLVDARTRFLITVPSYEALFCAHDRFLGHYRRYSFESLESVLERGGLSPVQSGRLFASLVPVRLAQVVRERLAGGANETTSVGLASWRGGETAARVLSGLLEWDGRVSLSMLGVGVRLPGLSSFAICRMSA